MPELVLSEGYNKTGAFYGFEQMKKEDIFQNACVS
jgi:hypothetical protein